MADTKISAMTADTSPSLTDLLVTVKDPGGTPVSRKVQIQHAMDLLEANMTVPTSVSSAYLTSTILASTSNAEGASLIGVEDGGLYWTATTVEGVLAEIGASTGALAALDDIGTAQIQADAVTPTELENTAVTPGSYTLGSFTVDAQGRLTAASSGTTDWSATVDADIVAGADGTISLGSETYRFASVHADAIDLNGTPLDGSSALAAPAGDRIMFYDLTAGGLAWLTVGTGLSISDTTITASASAPEGTAVLSTGEAGGTKFLREDGDNSSSWQPIPAPEGSAVLSTGEAGGVKFLREDGDGTSSWQAITALTNLNLTTPTITTNFTFDSVTVTGLTGADGNVVTGTAGTSGDLVLWNVDGDIVDGPTPPSGTIVGTTDTQTLTNKTLTDPKVSHSYNAQTGTTYTLVLADANKVVSMSNASANTLTIPTNASVAYPTGTIITVFALGAGTTTIAGDTGVTLSGNGGSGSAYSADIQTQYGAATIIKIGSDSWLISGDIDTVAA